MQIPLDYYRILGLPIQATPDQLRQAHRDRVQQMPRQEYSDIAVESRKKLLNEAFDLLANVDRRRAYDASFLNRTYGEMTSGDEGGGLGTLVADPHSPTIEIDDDQFVGTLLLLQELGEYELVLKLGRPFLKGGSATMSQGQFGDPKLVMPDIVLTVALACLELGREQWQQGQYENAAEALETGQQLLLREGVFPGVRSEIQADLFKLRPYRVLELVALPDQQVEERERGLYLLKEMLQDRGGIDGHEDDQSGLQIDDFLRFIQQLRSYMTASEQQALFEQEAQRPSAVGTYLAVYALLARGFGDRQPALVRRAKQLLLRLSGRQDVHLEQAVCGLLLGQTEEANRVLELSQEYEAIAFIREHSQGSPDLLPGLCLYTERWLQDEVMPHFRDLSRRRIALKDYFADPHVQTYLEALPAHADGSEPVPPRGASVSLGTMAGGTALAGAAMAGAASMASTALTSDRLSRVMQRQSDGMKSGSRLSGEDNSLNGRAQTHSRGAQNGRRPDSGARADVGRGGDSADRAQRDASMQASLPEDGDRAYRQSRPDGAKFDGPTSEEANGRGAAMAAALGAAAGAAAGATGTLAARSAARRKSEGPRGETRLLGFLPQGLLGLGLGLVGLLALCYALSQLLRAFSAPTPPPAQVTQQVAAPPAPPAPSPTAVTGDMNPDAAKQLIGLWLSAKSAAMGPNHDPSKLEQALAATKKVEWEQYVAEAKQEEWYKEYTHDVKIVEVQPVADNPDSVNVLADVREEERFHQSNQLANQLDKVHNLRYVFVRENGQWRIQSWSDR